MSGFFSSLPWYAWVAIVAILAAAFQKVVQSIHQHEERMEWIKQGRRTQRISMRMTRSNQRAAAS